MNVAQGTLEPQILLQYFPYYPAFSAMSYTALFAAFIFLLAVTTVIDGFIPRLSHRCLSEVFHVVLLDIIASAFGSWAFWLRYAFHAFILGEIFIFVFCQVISFATSPNFSLFYDLFFVFSPFLAFLKLIMFCSTKFTLFFRLACKELIRRDRRRVFLHWVPDRVLRWMLLHGILSSEDFRRIMYHRHCPTFPLWKDIAIHQNVLKELDERSDAERERSFERLLVMRDAELASNPDLLEAQNDLMIVDSYAASDVYDIQLSTVSRASHCMELVHHLYRAYGGTDADKLSCVWRFSNYLLENFRLVRGLNIVEFADKVMQVVFRPYKKATTSVAASLNSTADFLDKTLIWVKDYTNWFGAFQRVVLHFIALPVIGAERLLEHEFFRGMVTTRAVESLQETPAIGRIEDFVTVTSDFLRVVDSFVNPKATEGDFRFFSAISSIQGWSSEVKYLEDMIGSRSHKPGPGVITFDEFNKRVQACEKKRIMYTVAKTPFATLVTETRRRLEVISKAQRMITALNSEKPFVIALTGIAGAGKTELVRHLSRYILRKKPELSTLSDEILDEKIFSVIPSKNFVYENYNPENHYTVFFDEVGTITNPNNPVHPSILAVMEHGTHVLDQAAVEKKGVVLFKSKLIIINNNSEHFGLDREPKETGIHDQGAWFRRIDLHLHCSRLRPDFVQEGKLGPKSGFSSTLAIGMWNLYGYDKGNSMKPWGSFDYKPFPLTEALNILNVRYAEYQKKCQTYRALDDEDFSFLQCKDNPQDYNCSCCLRCTICLKTSAGPHHFCVEEKCPWLVTADSPKDPKPFLLEEDATPEEIDLGILPTIPEEPFESTSASSPEERNIPVRLAATAIVAACSVVWSTSLGAPFMLWNEFRFAAWLVFSTGVFFYDHSIADAFEARVASFVDLNFARAVDLFKVHPATYARHTKKILVGTVFVLFSSFTCFSLGVAALLGFMPNILVTLVMTSAYVAVGWRQFCRQRLARFFPTWFKVMKEQFRAQYGLDPDAIITSCMIFLTFLSGYKLWKTFQPAEKKPKTDIFFANSDRESTASPLTHVMPLVDVRSSRNPWDDQRKTITFSDNRISLDALVQRCKENQVRLQLRYKEGDVMKGDKVGGTAILGSFIISSYHAVRNLAKPHSDVQVFRNINKNYQIVGTHRYTTGAESVLPEETLHVDETGDVVLLNIKDARWKDLSRYVVEGCNISEGSAFRATIVFQIPPGSPHGMPGEVCHQSGRAQWTHQEVRLKGGEKLYEAWFYLFFPDDPEFKAYLGICGGVLLAHNQDGSQAGIVGVLSVATETYDAEGNYRILAGALPINKQKIANALDRYTRAVPASRPDGFPLSLENSYSNPRAHSYYGDVLQQYGPTEILGYRSDAVTFPKSRVDFYGWEDDVYRLMPDLRHDYVPPKFRGRTLPNGEYVHPGKHAISDLKGCCYHFSLVYQKAAFLQLVEDKMKHSDLASLYSIIPFSTDPSPSLSGIPASMIHQGIKRNTAAGYPWKGKKHKHLTINEDETVTPSSELVDAVHSRLAVLSEGRREWLITRGAYKDEPRSKEKVWVRKIRLFNPPDLPHYVVEHLVLSPLIQISLLMRGSFHTLGGMNVYSEEWSKIRENLEADFPCTIPGDFSKFDKGTSFNSMFTASEADLHLVRSSPYYASLDSDQQQAFENVFTSLASAMGDVALVVDGEFVAPGHGNGSGSADTYKKNCEVHALIAYECILTIIFFAATEPTCPLLDGSEDRNAAHQLAVDLMEQHPAAPDRLREALRHIVIIKHGDDGLYCVTREYVSLFNFVSFQQGYLCMGVKFTPSDKSDAIFSHKTWDEVDIGKRRWLWNEELQTYLAPLDKASIGKMLTIGLIVSQSVAEKREIGVQDAIREFAQYGREEFEKRLALLSVLCEEWKVPINTQQDWKKVVLDLRCSRDYTVICDDENVAQAAECAVQTEISQLPPTIPPEQAQDVATDLNAMHSADEPPAKKVPSHATMDSTSYTRPYGPSVAASDNSDDPNHQENIVATGDPESENVRFIESVQTYSLDMPSGQDSTFSETDARDAGFEGFLDRYIELDTIEWSTQTDLLEVLDVWTLWRTNARIAEKLKHFRYLRMELEVRFVISGTPFHFGQVMACYAPLLNYWGKDFTTGATATANKAKSSLYNFRHYATSSATHLKEMTDSYFSTFPHVMIMPGDNTPVEMTLPFIWTNNALRVNKTDAANSDGTTSMESPGSVVLTDLVHLGRASDTASRKVEISIWCRAKNISLNTPTVSVAASETQESIDSGFVAKMATGISSVAKEAGKVPVLAPYAKATEVAASTLGNVASLFGFSKPTNPSPAESYGVMNAKNIAVTNISDNSQKLTFDAHQEVSVDSRVIGHDGSDEMAISSIVKRWWWAGKAKWIPTTTDGTVTSKGSITLEPTLLWRSLVSPMQWRHTNSIHAVARTCHQLSPAGYVANTFRHWRGSISYRIQVIASRYHQGRVKIQFDPFNGVYNSDQVETRFTWILDLAQAREIEITIPYTSYRAYLNVMALKDTSTSDPSYSSATTASTEGTFDEAEHMGFLSISIVNDLVSPNGVGTVAGDGDAWVSVWTRMEDDAEFQVPSVAWHNNIIQCTGASDSHEMNDEEEEVIGASANPTPMWSVSMASNLNNVFFGERVLSIRSLMKRFIFVTNVSHEESSYKGRIIQRVTIPHWQPPSVSGQDRKNNYQMYFSPAFLARRGGQRFKCYNFQSTNGIINDNNSRKETESAYNIERKRSATYVGEAYALTRLNDTSAVVNAATYNTHVASGAAGGALVGYGLGHELIEVESPYYKPTRFDLSMWTEASLTPLDDGVDYLRFTSVMSANDNCTKHFAYYAAAGEDMSLMFFLAAPVIYET